MSEERRIEVGTAGGDPVRLPIVQVLTGRAAIMGKSGSGKSNTMSVVIEELLEAGYPVLIVDTDGEYYGLKEEYELLHAGADDQCDIQVEAAHAERIAGIALEENVPVILDVSGYLDEDEADALIRETARHLFAKEKKLKKPFLLVVEEVHEYIPEGGGMDETGRMLIKVGKRGRKHGLGIVGISQRPADVKKDFITQANWLVWHRLTWENDTKVVGRVVGDEHADAVADLDDGEAFIQRDWTDDEVTRIQFNRKRTFDAGATPGLEDVERPELKSVSDALLDDIEELSDERGRQEDRIDELEAELAEKNERIAELEEELRVARNVSQAAERMAEALADRDGGRSQDRPFGFEQRLRQKNERIEELEAQLDSLEADSDPRSDGAASGSTDEPADPERTADEGSETSQAEQSLRSSDAGSTIDDGPKRGVDDSVERHMDRLRRRGERLLAVEAAAADDVGSMDEIVALLRAEPVAERIDGARRASRCNREHTWSVLAALSARNGLRLQELDPLIEQPREAVQSLLSELRAADIVERDSDGRYSLDTESMRDVVRGVHDASLEGAFIH